MTPLRSRTWASPRPRLGFIGIHAGKRLDTPVSQNEMLAKLFASDGFVVRRASAIKGRVGRTLHQLLALLLWRDVDLLVIAVFSGTSFRIAEFSTLLGRLRGRRLVLFLHGGNLPVFGPAHRRRVERAFQRADLIVAPSDYLAETFRSWGYDVRIIPNVLAIERYSYTPRSSARPSLLWMRTFHEHYDPLLAIKVFARVVEHHRDATMVMGGADHGLLQATKDEAVRLGVADRITFPGYITAEVKQAAFADCDIYLNTNILDNMPVSLLEAAASGLVPVATAVGGIPAMVTDDVDGVLVPTGDVDAMADQVLDLLRNDQRFARLSSAARQMAERSAWPQVEARWFEELSLVLPGAVFE